MLVDKMLGAPSGRHCGMSGPTVANADQKPDVDVDRLVVRNITADEGPVLKRWGTKARGRGTRILKPTCHITVVLSEKSSV